MPIYEYVCPRCQHLFEALQRMGATESPPCEKCGCEKTERQFSTFAMGGGSARGSSSGSSCSGCAKSSCSGCR